MAIATSGSPEAATMIQQEALKVANPEMSGREAAKQQLAAIHKKEGARAALEAAKKSLDPKEKFTHGVKPDRAKKAIEANIHEGKGKGKVDQQDKRNKMTTVVENADVFVREGYDALKPPANSEMATAVIGRLSETWLGENIKAMSGPDRVAFFDSFVKDPQYATKMNELLQERINKQITHADKAARFAELQAVDPKATWEQAAGQLEQEWQESITNIPADAVSAVLAQNLENASKVTEEDADKIDQKAADIAAENNRQLTEEAKQKAKQVMDKLRERWSDKDQRGILGFGDVRKGDFDAYASGGLKAVFDRAGIDPADQTAILDNPDVRAAYDSQFAESFVNQRLRIGKLTKENIYNIADDPALGPDQATRVAKLQSMMEAHKQLQNIIKAGQADGSIQRDLWDKMKGLNPLKRKNVLLALLSTLVLPVSVGAVLVQHDMGK